MSSVILLLHLSAHALVQMTVVLLIAMASPAVCTSHMPSIPQYCRICNDSFLPTVLTAAARSRLLLHLQG